MKPVVKQFGAQMQSTLIVFKGPAEQGRSVGDTKQASIATLLDKSLVSLRDRARAGLRGRTAVDPVALRAAVGTDRARRGGRRACVRCIGVGGRSCSVLYGTRAAARAGGFGLGVDAGMLRVAAAAIMIVLGVVLVVPSWQARLRGGRRPGFQLGRSPLRRLCFLGLAGQFAIGLLLGAKSCSATLRRPDARRGIAAGLPGPRSGAGRADDGGLGIGAAVPLILLGLLSRATLVRVRSRLMSAGKLGKGLLGAAFILIGVAIVSGADKRIEAALVDASPQWLTELTTSF